MGELGSTMGTTPEMRCDAILFGGGGGGVAVVVIVPVAQRVDTRSAEEGSHPSGVDKL